MGTNIEKDVCALDSRENGSICFSLSYDHVTIALMMISWNDVIIMIRDMVWYKYEKNPFAETAAAR